MNPDWEREEPRDNAVAGTVGAFLGSLIGVACIVLVNQLGYVSAICGAVMEAFSDMVGMDFFTAYRSVSFFCRTEM